MESASYIESNSDFEVESNIFSGKGDVKENLEEESTPKLFTEEQSQERIESKDIDENSGSDQLFDQDNNEEEDFEIPAFLRRQKF